MADEANSSSDETIDFNHELSSGIGEEDLNEEEILDRIRPRRHLKHDPVRFSTAIEKAKENISNFKVIGQTNVALTCNPTLKEASWVTGSTQFSASITSKEELCGIESLGSVSEELAKALIQFTDVLFPVQQAVIPAIIEASRSVLPPRDFVISAPTGSGKTLSFVIPILNALRHVQNDASAVYALIIAPVQNLARQIYTEFSKYNVHCARVVLLNGTNDYEVERASLFPSELLDGGSHAHIIVSTPGRLVEHLVDSRGIVNLSQLRFLVVDEADRIQDTARMEWLGIVERRANVSPTNNLTLAELMNPRLNRYLQKILCSATLSLDFDHLHVWNLRYPKLFKADSSSVVLSEKQDAENLQNGEKLSDEQRLLSKQNLILPSNLKHQVILCQASMKPAFLHLTIKSEKNWKKILIFVNQKTDVRKLTVLLSNLARSSYKVEEFSSSLYGNRRERCLKQFEEGKIRVLVSSDVLSRGIDVSEIDCVINYNPPINERIFVHRVGRTARGLSHGVVISLVDKPEKMRLKRMLVEMNVWQDEFLLDRRETEKYINQSLLRKYNSTLEYLKSLKSETGKKSKKG